MTIVNAHYRRTKNGKKIRVKSYHKKTNKRAHKSRRQPNVLKMLTLKDLEEMNVPKTTGNLKKYGFTDQEIRWIRKKDDEEKRSYGMGLYRMRRDNPKKGQDKHYLMERFPIRTGEGEATVFEFQFKKPLGKGKKNKIWMETGSTKMLLPIDEETGLPPKDFDIRARAERHSDEAILEAFPVSKGMKLRQQGPVEKRMIRTPKEAGYVITGTWGQKMPIEYRDVNALSIPQPEHIGVMSDIIEEQKRKEMIVEPIYKEKPPFKRPKILTQGIRRKKK